MSQVSLQQQYSMTRKYIYLKPFEKYNFKKSAGLGICKFHAARAHLISKAKMQKSPTSASLADDEFDRSEIDYKRKISDDKETGILFCPFDSVPVAEDRLMRLTFPVKEKKLDNSTAKRTKSKGKKKQKEADQRLSFMGKLANNKKRKEGPERDE